MSITTPTPDEIITPDPKPRCVDGQQHTWNMGILHPDGSYQWGYVKCMVCEQVEKEGAAAPVDTAGTSEARPTRELTDQVLDRAAALAARGPEGVQQHVTEDALQELLEALGNVHMQLRNGQRATDSDIASESPLLLPREMVQGWAGEMLTPCDMERLTAAIPHSSIPEAVAEIVAGMDLRS